MAGFIEFDGTTVRFDQGAKSVTAVDRVSLEIQKGEFFGIVGQSGAGKSTLVRTVNLLQRPTSGRVLYNGRDITGLRGRELSALRLKTGMIFQHFNLIRNSTVFENVAFALLASKTPKDRIAARTNEVLALVGLSDKSGVYPAELSGGQKQRVAIARALANSPEVLLCDEATSALDPDNTREVMDALKHIREVYPITVLFITHQMEVARSLFGRVAVMESGKVVETASAYELFAHPRSAAARSLVSRSVDYELPDEVLEHEKNLFFITYREDRTYEAVIAEVAQRFGVKISIIAGKIDYIQKKPLGVLLVDIPNNDAAKRALALDFIRQYAFVTPFQKGELP